MNSMKAWVSAHRALVRSVPVSLVCFALDYGLLYALTEWAGIHYLASASVAFALANTLNYLLCAWWVFPERRSRRAGYMLFVVAGAVGLGLNAGLMALMTGWLQLHYMLSKIIASTLVFFWNYAMRAKVIFPEEGRG